jgi:hypothetical protein
MDKVRKPNISVGMKSVSNFTTISQLGQKLKGGTYRETGDLTSLLFLQKGKQGRTYMITVAHAAIEIRVSIYVKT